MDRMDEPTAVDSVIRWLRIRECSGHPVPTSYAELIDTIGNSALLKRLLAGRTPLQVAPPRSFGHPWYSLVEDGVAADCELRPLRDRPGATLRVAINEAPWEVVEQPAEDRLVVRYGRAMPLFVAERSQQDPERWRLVRRDLWAEQPLPRR
jgi:hypothetical protein